MKTRFPAFLLVVAIAFLAPVLMRLGATGPAADPRVERGRYLVEGVAMCGDCHTPKTEKGQYDRAQWLQGDVLEFKPTHPMPWSLVAPPIAGLPSFTKDEQAVAFFETGTNAFGRTALPPMPQLRLNHDDSLAVVAYLRSLKR
jgi:hypothetical protein